MVYMNDMEQDIAFFYDRDASDADYYYENEYETPALALDHVYTVNELATITYESYEYNHLYLVSDVLPLVNLYIEFALENGVSWKFTTYEIRDEHCDVYGTLETEPISVNGTVYTFPRLTMVAGDLIYLLHEIFTIHNMVIPLPPRYSEWGWN